MLKLTRCPSKDGMRESVVVDVWWRRRMNDVRRAKTKRQNKVRFLFRTLHLHPFLIFPAVKPLVKVMAPARSKKVVDEDIQLSQASNEDDDA